MNKNYFIKIFIFFGLCCFIFFFSFVFSQGLEVEYPKIRGITPSRASPYLYVTYVYYFTAAFVGLLAFIILVFAGFKYLTSAGDPEVKSSAKKMIFAAFLGIIILSFTPLILKSLRKEFLFMPEETPAQISEPVTLPLSPEGWVKEPVLHPKEFINRLAEEMTNISFTISSTVQALESALEQCKCGNIEKSSCNFTEKECIKVICDGEPCVDREQIQLLQTRLKMHLEQILFYGRLFEDVRKNITPQLFSLNPTAQILQKIEMLKIMISKLDPLFQELKEKIFKLMLLVYECLTRVKSECEPKCELETDGCYYECHQRPCEPLDKNPCPMDEINRVVSEISTLTSQINQILAGISALNLK